MAKTSDEDSNALPTDTLVRVLGAAPKHTCSQPSFGYPQGKSFDCPACIEADRANTAAREAISLAGCLATGVGGFHSDSYADLDDGVCQHCGLMRADAGIAKEDTLRAQRGYVPAPKMMEAVIGGQRMQVLVDGPLVEALDASPTLPSGIDAGFQVEDAFTIKGPLLAGEGLAVEAMALAHQVQERKEAEAADAGIAPERATCELCNTPLKTQRELNDGDFDDLQQLSQRLHSLLSDRHPGVAMWCCATSDTLNAISLVLKRSGI
jgi:hypothetical protein